MTQSTRPKAGALSIASGNVAAGVAALGGKRVELHRRQSRKRPGAVGAAGHLESPIRRGSVGGCQIAVAGQPHLFEHPRRSHIGDLTGRPDTNNLMLGRQLGNHRRSRLRSQPPPPKAGDDPIPERSCRAGGRGGENHPSDTARMETHSPSVSHLPLPVRGQGTQVAAGGRKVPMRVPWHETCHLRRRRVGGEKLVGVTLGGDTRQAQAWGGDDL